MNKEDKELNKIFDRLVAGEKISSAGVSEEMREKILAAEKLLACTTDPAPDFQENLKRRVINLFESRQAAVKPHQTNWRERLARFLAAPSVWRTATVAVTVGAIALLVVWAAGLLPFQSPVVPPVVGVTPPAIIKVEPAAPGVVSVLLGSEVRVEILFRNTGEGTVTIKPFPPEIWMSNPLDRTPLRTFAAGEGEFEILPSGKVAYTLIWDQKSGKGEQVPPGIYVVSAVNVSMYQGDNPQPAVSDFPAVVQIEIKPMDLGSW